MGFVSPTSPFGKNHWNDRDDPRTGSWAIAMTLSMLPLLCLSTGTQHLGRRGADFCENWKRSILDWRKPETIGIYVEIFTRRLWYECRYISTGSKTTWIVFFFARMLVGEEAPDRKRIQRFLKMRVLCSVPTDRRTDFDFRTGTESAVIAWRFPFRDDGIPPVIIPLEIGIFSIRNHPF